MDMGTVIALIKGLGGGGSGDAEKISGTATFEVGGIKKGDTYNGTVGKVLKQALSAETAPSVSVAMTPNLIEKGVTQDVSCKVTFTKGSVDVSKLELSGGITETITSPTSPITRTLSGVSADATVTAKVTGGTKSATASGTVKFVDASYYGADGKTLTKLLTTTYKQSLSFTLADEKAIYKYPASYGTVSKITDSSGADDYTSAFASSTETIGGVTYKVYTAKEKATLTAFIYKFS